MVLHLTLVILLADTKILVKMCGLHIGKAIGKYKTNERKI